jgi:hypothetical protein
MVSLIERQLAQHPFGRLDSRSILATHQWVHKYLSAVQITSNFDRLF